MIDIKPIHENLYLVLDLGGTFTKYALMTPDCQILKKDKFPSVREPLPDFLTSIAAVYEQYRNDISGIAVSLPGILDNRSGHMYTGGYFSCLSGQNLTALLKARCSVPVSIANDAKCAGMAELWRGSLKGCESGVVLVCGTGIGGCIIYNGKVMEGTHFMAGEFSYSVIEGMKQPQLSNAFGFRCGIDSLLMSASQKTGISRELLNGELLFSMAGEGDKHALEAIREYARCLAVQIHNYQFILDPQRFAIGGGISEQPLLLTLIREELAAINRQYAPWSIPMPQVAACTFYNDANLIGALYHHLTLHKGGNYNGS